MTENNKSNGSSRNYVWAGASFVTVSVIFAAAWSSGGAAKVTHAAPLPIGPSVPSFALTRQDGKPVSSKDLAGQVWVADFIYSACPGPCPKLSARLRGIQRELAPYADRVKLVSFSLDPENDKPHVLTRYAQRFNADPKMWWFLTGDSEDEMFELVEKGFFQTVFAATKQQALIHSNHLLIIDQAGRFRSSYDGLDGASKDQVVHDVIQLLNESPST